LEEYWNPHTYSADDYTGLDLRLNDEPTETDLFGPFWMQEQLLSYVPQWASQTEPFFTYVAYQLSHSPFDAPDDYLDLYDNGDDNECVFLCVCFFLWGWGCFSK